jgi:hypothetical protein
MDFLGPGGEIGKAVGQFQNARLDAREELSDCRLVRDKLPEANT